MADWGMKISKPGINVGTATDANDLIFTSSLDTLKVKSLGTFNGVGTVAHGLSYTPIFWITGGGFAPLFGGGLKIDSTNLISEQSGTIRYLIFYKQY